MKPRYFVVLCWAWILCAFLKMAFYGDLEKGEARTVFIPRGVSVSKVASLLESEGIAPKYLFLLFVLFTQREKVVAGHYRIPPGRSIHRIVQELENGPPREKVTFPEGLTSVQMARLLEEKGICNGKEYLELAAHPEVFQKEWLQGVSHLEGFLFPDTYYLPLSSSPQEVIEMQLKQFEKLVLPLYEKNSSPLSLKEVVILASIVEKEARSDEEKPYVASVFLNRLKRGMRLQSCATVVYAHYQEKGVHLENLTTQDLEIDSPFNTYLYKGLPPQAIGNPGLEAIRAVLYPEKTDYLYFVLQENGKHSFSTTYEEHLKKKGGHNEKTRE
ncbi:MAG: endolytic transglycosylase MltG [Atribacterota bacterium]|nr:endolytic transglycosylase MltG [Atribacterota bacterium]